MNSVEDLKPHRLAELFPLLPMPELTDLAEDIRTHGLREPLVVYQGKILDGRNRYQACALAEVEPRIRHFDGSDTEARDLVLSLNLHRRHLNESQRAMIAARIATLPKGLRADRSIDLSMTQADAAECYGFLCRPLNVRSKFSRPATAFSLARWTLVKSVCQRRQTHRRIIGASRATTRRTAASNGTRPPSLRMPHAKSWAASTWTRRAVPKQTTGLEPTVSSRGKTTASNSLGAGVSG